MNVHGTQHLAASRAAVFDAIRDPRVLLAVIPGCQSVEEVAPGEYEGRVTLRLPGAAGTYRTHVRLVDVDAPQRADVDGARDLDGRMDLDGRVDGPMGSIAGRASFTLAEDTTPGTTITWHGTGTIQGPLARLDGRFAEGLAELLVERGLRVLDARLTTTTEGPE